MITRIRAWWQGRIEQREMRQFHKEWNRKGPGEQIAAIISMLHHSPELRGAFRDALYGKTHEARRAEPRRKANERQVKPGFR